MYWYKDTSLVKEFYDQHIGDTPRSIIRKGFVTFIFLSFLVAGIYFFVIGTNYYDIRENCYIKIHYDVLNGNRDSIIKALKKIKLDNFMAYYNICKNVTDIYERQCVEPDKTNKYKIALVSSDGCYIKGSSSILISPPAEMEYDLIDKRVAVILKYSGILEKYLQLGDKYLEELDNPKVLN